MTVTIAPAEDAFDDLIVFARGMERVPSDIENQGVSIISAIVQDAAGDNFGREGSAEGRWRALAPATVAERIRLGYGGEHPILQRTGEYLQSFTGGAGFVEESEQAGGIWTIAIGSDDYRATTHEFGRDAIPARPVLAFDESVGRRIEAGVARIYDLIEGRTRG